MRRRRRPRLSGRPRKREKARGWTSPLSPAGMPPSRVARTRLARDGHEARPPTRDELLRPGEVVLVVDVQPLVALGEERRLDHSLAGPGRLDHPRPCDLERAVLHVDGRKGLVLARVPGDVEEGLVAQRSHEATDLVDP